MSPLCICTGPVAQRSEVMRWKSLGDRSHLRRRACRREASIGRRPNSESTPPTTHQLRRTPDYHLWVPNPGEMFDANATGTRNAMEAAGSVGVRKIIYTSSV